MWGPEKTIFGVQMCTWSVSWENLVYKVLADSYKPVKRCLIINKVWLIIILGFYILECKNNMFDVKFKCRYFLYSQTNLQTFNMLPVHTFFFFNHTSTAKMIEFIEIWCSYNDLLSLTSITSDIIHNHALTFIRFQCKQQVKMFHKCKIL